MIVVFLGTKMRKARKIIQMTTLFRSPHLACLIHLPQGRVIGVLVD